MCRRADHVPGPPTAHQLGTRRGQRIAIICLLVVSPADAPAPECAVVLTGDDRCDVGETVSVHISPLRSPRRLPAKMAVAHLIRFFNHQQSSSTRTTANRLPVGQRRLCCVIDLRRVQCFASESLDLSVSGRCSLSRLMSELNHVKQPSESPARRH